MFRIDFRHIAGRFSIRILSGFIVATALLLGPNAPLLIRGESLQQRNNRNNDHARRGRPEGNLPDLDQIRQESEIEREAPAPIPSTVRSPKNAGKPWDGKRVGDPGLTGHLDHRTARTIARAGASSMMQGGNKINRAHARRRTSVPPPTPDDQFLQNFFNWALVRTPTSQETTYWSDQLRVGYGQGQTSLRLAAIEFGRTLFESAEYAARNRDAHWYVYDLYKTYLMRDPDSGGWNFWESLVPTHGREFVRRGFEDSGEFGTLIANITPNGSAGPNASSLISARVDPSNEPGSGMLGRDASWNVSLLSLPGRNNLDLGLSLAYSSMVWTRSGPYIYFDEDNGFPSPGFRLGFPTVQRKVFDAQAARNAYLLITASGRRVELRQVGISNIYDAADSSYLRLTDNGTTLLVHSTDGTKLSFSEINGEFRCVEIKDRNGNYITVNNNAAGRISTITDTLGRIITFNYDGNGNLLSVTQSWNGQPSHQWVSFGWGTRTIQSSFSGAAVVGTANGTVLPVITQVGLNDTSHFTFDYTNSLQVSAVRNYFGALERHATIFNYETPASDVPRLVSSSLSAHNWSGLNNVPSQVTTQYSVAGDGACVRTAPDGTVYKEYYGTGWQKGLTTLSEVWSGGVRQRWTTTAWTQDNTGVSYQTNPRVTETNVYDSSGNRRRTVIDYGPYAQYGLPYGVREFASDGVTEIRQTYTDYNLAQAYLDRRIIGLVSQVHLTNVAQWQAKITYDYDDPGRLFGVPSAATQHDVNYNLSFTARGNVTAVSRWDVTDIINPSKKLTTYTNYYNTGTPIATIDAAGHQNSMIYADSFSDNINRNTFAYPTTITDGDGFSSYVQYNYDFGATTRSQAPTPAGQSQGAIQTITYNSLGQLERITTTNNGAYKRFWYGAEYVASYETVNNIADEFYSIEVTDGLGQVIGAVTNHPGSNGGYSLVNNVYDKMRRVWLRSNATEVNNSWVTTGDDSAGIYYTQQVYDWQGRPTTTTNPDNSTKQIGYGGCGCAGGEIITLTDETGRQQRLTNDVLGRTWKTELLNTNGTVYSTAEHTFNARNQITSTKLHQGDLNGTYQEIIQTYDGYGRLSSRKRPVESGYTTYSYWPDDTVQMVKDARNATATFTHNNRHMVTKIEYGGAAGPGSPPPAGVEATATVQFGFDAAGNRTSMSDGSGSASYQYDSLSRMTSETKLINGLNGSLTITYDYNLLNQVTRITDPFGDTIYYNHDTAARMNSITGSPYGGVTTYASNIKYRAWNDVKEVSYGSGYTLSASYNNRLKPSEVQLSKQSLTRKHASYQYYANGLPRYLHDFEDERFDRAFAYDQINRMTEAYTGSEARDFINNTSSGPPTGPFRGSYQYNAWGDRTNNTSRYWAQAPQSISTSYSNGRNQDPEWQYDAAGNLKETLFVENTYDAAGYNVLTQELWWVPQKYVNREWRQLRDGDGKVMVESARYNWEPSFHRNRHLLYSTVLGGRVIAELDGYQATPVRLKGYVFAGAEQIATHEYRWKEAQQAWLPTVVWHYQDHMTGSRGAIDETFMRVTELDPTGVDIGVEDPYVNPGYVDTGYHYGAVTQIDVDDPYFGGQCLVDGLYMSCEQAFHMIYYQQSAAVCPNNDCGPRAGTDANGNPTWRFVEINSNGEAGYWDEEKQFVGYSYTGVKDESGSASGRWKPEFEVHKVWRGTANLALLLPNGHGLDPDPDPGTDGESTGETSQPQTTQPRCNPYFFAEESRSEDTLGNRFRGADLNIFARLIYSESSNNEAERAAVGSVIYNRLTDGPHQSFEALARSGGFEAVTGPDTRAFDRTAPDVAGNLSADDCAALRGALDTVLTILNSGPRHPNFRAFRGGRTPLRPGMTLIGNSRFAANDEVFEPPRR